MNYKCEDCEAEFNEMEQTRSEYEAGQCPCCHSERIKEVNDG
jgi:DNA-directed RNA polymerase subunit RPC12/RpoP